MSDHERTLEVIEGFYDAALNESLWPAALDKLTRLTKSQASSFWVLDGSSSPRLPTFIFTNFDPAAVQEYLDGMAQFDPTVRYLVHNPRKIIVHDGLLGDMKKDEASRAYAHWHELNIETRFRMVAQVHVASDVQAGIALHRTHKAGRYEAKDIRRFATLHRHLKRALAIGVRLGSMEAMRQFRAEWLDHSNAAIVLLDERGRVVFANRRAAAVQSQADGVRLTATGITLSAKEDDARLQALISRASSLVAPLGISEAGTMRAARPSGKRPFGIFVAPVSRNSTALSLFRPAVCLVITDPEDQPPLSLDRLRTAFDFTKAEAQLAALIVVGMDLRAAADELKITYGTARTRLAQIFQKTDTRRQGELIHLLLTTMSV